MILDNRIIVFKNIVTISKKIVTMSFLYLNCINKEARYQSISSKYF